MAAPAPRRPGEALASAGVVVGAGVVLSLVYALTGWGVPCLLRATTGWLCPFCGGTHLGVALLHGDLAGAWRSNPVVFVAGGLLGLRLIGWTGEVIRHPDRGTRWVPWAVARYWPVALVVVCIAWTLARNLA
ncbi:MAG: DUF2752 domain-containing protein [Propionibacteriaceae bacterium]|nr:DUF2752 domain-containing protein [Propionibacteriaceae bacterium]